MEFCKLDAQDGASLQQRPDDRGNHGMIGNELTNAALKLTALTTPTLSPKLRSEPRRSFSMS
jgi:hypothetical protein